MKNSNRKHLTAHVDNVIPFNKAKAARLFEDAYDAQRNGQIAIAKSLYSESINWFPTAQAFTFLGWAYSVEFDYEKAIELCKQAIAIDPNYGNPYNDIGAYLIELGREDDAISWLKKAIASKDYECPHYPYFNLGRVYEEKNQIRKAIHCFERAISLRDNFEAAHVELQRLKKRLN